MKSSHVPERHLSQLHLGGLQVLRQAPQLPRHVFQLVLPTAEGIDIPWMTIEIVSFPMKNGDFQ